MAVKSFINFKYDYVATPFRGLFNEAILIAV